HRLVVPGLQVLALARALGPVVYRVARQDRTHVRREGLADGVLGRLAVEGRLEAADVLGPGHQAGDGPLPGVAAVGLDVRVGARAFVLEGAVDDLFQGADPAVPELVAVVDAVDQARRVGLAGAWELAVGGEALSRDVAGGARDVPGRVEEFLVEKQTFAQAP